MAKTKEEIENIINREYNKGRLGEIYIDIQHWIETNYDDLANDPIEDIVDQFVNDNEMAEWEFRKLNEML